MAKSLFRSTSVVMLNTCFSRILGFVRTMVFAHLFGAVAGMDAFLVAFRIPNLMRKLFAEGAFSQAFVPVLSEYRLKHSNSEVKRFLDYMAGALGLILLCVTIVGILCAPGVVSVFAPGFTHIGPRFLYATDMLRITMPYLLLISLTALCGAILNTYDDFGWPSFNPVLLNVVLIGMAICASPYFHVPIYSLAWGVCIAGFVQLFFLLPILYFKRLMPIPRINFKDPGVRRVLKLIVPAIFGVSVAQLSIIIDNVFASFLKVGSVSWLFYSDRVMGFPLGVFAVAIATVILPKLSRQYADSDSAAYSKTMDWSLRLLLLVGLPASLGTLALAGPIMTTLFKYGQFSQYDVIMSTRSLMTFSVGIQAFMLIKVFASGFYARQNIKTPVKIAIVAVVTNIICNAILIFPLAHAGLALSTSIAAFVNAGLLLFVLLKKKLYTPQPGWLVYGIRLALANALLVGFLWWGVGSLQDWLESHWFWRGLHLMILIGAATIIYFGALLASGLRMAHFKERQA